MGRNAVVSMVIVVCLGASSAYADLTLNDGGTHDINYFVSGSLHIHNNVAPPPTTTTVNLWTGGSIEYSLFPDGSSLVNMYGGSIGGNLNARDRSTVNVNGGSIVGGLTSEDNSIVNIYGGSVGRGVGTPTGGTANIYGGSISSVLFAPEGIVNVYGVGFNYPYGPITATSGTLTGTLYMGDSLSVDFERIDPP